MLFRSTVAALLGNPPGRPPGSVSSSSSESLSEAESDMPFGQVFNIKKRGREQFSDGFSNGGSEDEDIKNVHADTARREAEAAAERAVELAKRHVESVRKHELRRKNIANIETALGQPCCQKDCQKGCTVSHALGIREFYGEFSTHDQQQWLLNCIWEWRGAPSSWKAETDPQTGKTRFSPDPEVRPAPAYFKIGSKPVCK